MWMWPSIHCEKNHEDDKFPDWEMTFLKFLVEIKEIEVGGATMTLQGIASYTTSIFHIYEWPKITPQNSRGIMSLNTSSFKGVIP